MKIIDQLAAEAEQQIEFVITHRTVDDIPAEIRRIIKAAIEKATEEERSLRVKAENECLEYARMLRRSRAAHASGEGTTQERYNELARKTPRESKSPTGAAHASE